MTTLVDRAIEFATKAHEGQLRKGSPPRPYITHPLDVLDRLWMAGVDDHDILAAAVLHDVIEDCGVTADELVEEFGTAVAALVVEVTDEPGLSKREAKEAQERKAPHMSRGAALIKLADKTSNLADIVAHPPEWKRDSVLGYRDSCVRIVEALGDVDPWLRASFDVAAKAVRA